MKSKLTSLCGLAMLAFGTAGFSEAAALFIGPSPYLGFDNALPGAGSAISPFSGLSFSYFYLETFEDGALNTPGVSADHGFVGCYSVYEDSVDADDGVIDGNGNGGHSWGSFDNSISFTSMRVA